MKETGAPYGEARRLRYFVVICRELLGLPSVDIDLFIDRLLRATGNINLDLSRYLRETGILQSRAVARNYLRFADWLGFLRIENRIVVPNSYTVFFAKVNGRNDFFLSEKEKVAFFLKLTELEKFVQLIGSLRIKNSIQDFVKLLNVSEHFIESYFEWLVDLAILKPTQRKFGVFDLSNLGYQVLEASRNARQKQNNTCSTYIENLLGIRLESETRLSEDDVWNLLEMTLSKLGQYTRSEVDSELYSAYPLVLDMQIRLIFDHHLMISIPHLIDKLKDISPSHNAIFSWDSLAVAGYVKFHR